jgi:VWFA-related protein
MQQSPSLDGNALITSLNNSQADLRVIGRSAGYWGATERLQTSLEQLGQLAQLEAAKPGRKLVFFLSPGWPMLPGSGIEETEKQRQWTFGYIVGLSNGLRAAQITLYSVDPFALGRTDPFYYQAFIKGVANANKAEYPSLGLQVLVTHTGGIAETDGTDILGGLNNAIRDADACYTLTFEAPPADRLNEYHDLQLKVDKPGVTVRTTSGYYANVAPAK